VLLPGYRDFVAAIGIGDDFFLDAGLGEEWGHGD